MICPWHFIANLRFLSLGHRVVKNLICLFVRPVYREALSPQTGRGSIWPCRCEPCDSRWKNPHPTPISKAAPTLIVLSTASSTNPAQTVSVGGERAINEGNGSSLLPSVNPVWCEWKNSHICPDWLKRGALGQRSWGRACLYQRRC